MRRLSFLKATVFGATAFGAEPSALPPAMLADGNAVAAYGVPSPFEADVVRRPSGLLSPALTPLGDLTGTITPSGLCFTRNHAGVPQIDPHAHRLLVHGLVRRPLTFTVADLLRFPAVTRTHFLECAGNGAPGWQQLGATVQFSHGLASNCEWTGAALRDVLEEAGANANATWVLAEGADGDLYERSIPLAAALDGALIVYAQNGERLRPEQGYPLRLLLPGLEGSANVKWLRRLHVTDAPAYSRNETASYARLNRDGTRTIFDLTMDVKSVVTTPSAGQRLAGRGAYEIRGLAWSGHGRIAAVDVTLDDGATWQPAALHDPVLPKAFTRFSMPLRFDGSELRVASRARDDAGRVQPTAAEFAALRGLDATYHVNAIQTWRVAADGAVSLGS